MTQNLAPLLERHPFCQGFDPAHLALMAGCAENLSWADGEALARVDQPAEHGFLIRAGRVALYLNAGGKRLLLETVEEGELLGWSWLYPPYRWQFDAIAQGPVRALRLDGSCLRRKCETDPAFGFSLTRRILQQAQTRLERSRLQALDVYGRGPR